MNMLQEHIREFINPYPNRYTRGDYEIRVLPHEDLDYDGVQKFWRLFKKFPNDFAAAAVSLLPRDVKFVQYDHLNNILFATKQ
jgi:hypothetical protein|tara:strand:- start:482 stop:730 length:249 start_codon:yes stop_codon:yes gene_type:complete